jgi:hypothetical protein
MKTTKTNAMSTVRRGLISKATVEEQILENEAGNYPITDRQLTALVDLG